MGDEKPRHGQRVLYATHLASIGTPKYDFKGFLRVSNPYQDDKKFNPEYWERQLEIGGTNQRISVSDSDIWCELELPLEIME